MTTADAERILIAGAGYVGCELARRLHAAGSHVFALSRHPDQQPFGVHALGADVNEPRSLLVIPNGIAVVVYLVSPDSNSQEAYRAAYVQGLRHLLECPKIQSSPVRRVLFASSTAVYEQDDGSWVDETSPTLPRRFSGLSLLEAEAQLAGSGLAFSIVRFAGIYGPGRQRLLRQVLEGSAVFGCEPHITNRIHRDDCAGFLQHLIGMRSTSDVYIGVDSEPAELRVVLEWLARKTGRPLPRPSPDAAPAARGRNKRCSNQRLLETGYRLAFPTFREGYGALL